MPKKDVKKEERKEIQDQDQSEAMILKGLVVNWTLPSKATLQDWLKQDNPDIRIREIVELFPEEIFKDLEAIRRGFYRHVQMLVLPAYSLKLLPFDSLPKIQITIENTRENLKVLDKKIEEALNSDYYKKASQYYKNTSGLNPKSVSNLSERFTVMMIPLRLDSFVWEDFLTEEMEKQKKRITEVYNRDKAVLESSLLSIHKKISDAQKTLDVKQKDILKADEVLDEIYEPVKLPVDVATLRIEKKELQNEIKDLRYIEKRLKRERDKLESQKRNNFQNLDGARTWARQETKNTEKAISFDVKKLWNTTLEDLIRKSVDSLEALKIPILLKALETIKEAAEDTLERIWSVQPTSKLIPKYEKFIGILVEALNGKDVKASLEGFY